MTQAELNKVRNLRDEVDAEKQRLATLRLAVQNLSPVLDGMPHTPTQASRVEKLAVLILDSERDLDELLVCLEDACVELSRKLKTAPLDPIEHKILVLRYVACMSFTEIEDAVNLSEARVYFWHRQGVQKLLDNKNDKTIVER